ncbi:hypothetical protein FPRO06_12228 [Fusarium proliferatum]|nr:hypothetical protein FPRO06_12228 [Fusarium proliferatum]
MATNSETADSWSQSITLTLISTSHVTYDDLDLDVSCTVQVSRAIASVEDDVLPIRGTYESPGDIKGGDDSYRLPHTQALTVSPIKIENRTNSEILDINFEIEDTEDGTEAFEPRMTAILQIDNDGEGLQTGDPTGARQINFEFVLWAMPERFISLGGTDPVEMVRTFKVSCPPKAGTTV